MSNGQVATGCHEVENSCNYGCSPSDIRYKCKSGENSYVLWYGNTGCGVFKRGVQNYKGFCLRINILKANY